MENQQVEQLKVMEDRQTVQLAAMEDQQVEQLAVIEDRLFIERKYNKWSDDETKTLLQYISEWVCEVTGLTR